MVEEEVVALSPPAPLDHHKRKLEDVEREAAMPDDESAVPASEGEQRDDQVAVKEVSAASEAKRPRVDLSETEGLAAENGHQNENEDAAQQNNPQSGAKALGEEHNLAEEVSIAGNDEASIQEDVQKGDSLADHVQLPSAEIERLDNVVKPSEDDFQPVDERSWQGVTDQNLSESSNQTTSRRMEVPNNMVGVLIGKAGDTIRYLQYNSGAKIQITRDADADPGAATRSVEVIGTLNCINKAEKLIKEVIAEADAGGSPALVARGFTLAAGAMEQIQIQVPNEKVGLIIGKGGETIKNLQTRSGARIQLVPQHLPDGDESKERTIRVSGDKKQIDMAREFIKEVMNQNLKPSTLLSNYGQQQGYHPRGPPGALPQWGPHGPRNTHSMPYDYQQHRGGPYPSQNQQYPPYGGYQSQGPPRGNYGSGWEHRPPMQGLHHHRGGYDYYGGQGGGHAANVSPMAPHSTHVPSARPTGSSMGPNINMSSPAQANYNYGQPRYSQTVSSHQSYGQRYAEPKYDGQAPMQQPFGGSHGASQPGTYPDAQGYPNQQQYPSAAPYSVPSQGAPPPQSYPASQPGSMPYQAPVSAALTYGASMPAQQPYPYGSVPATTNDGYSQPQQAVGSMPGYPQQGVSQPVAGYGQPVTQQQTPGYPQAYGQYPQVQHGYSNQTTAAAAAASYGYQGQADPSAYATGQMYSTAPPTAGQTAYAQPATSQAGYDQSLPQQPGGYPAAASAAAPAAYGKTLSPQPAGVFPQQYDASQMYGASG